MQISKKGGCKEENRVVWLVVLGLNPRPVPTKNRRNKKRLGVHGEMGGARSNISGLIVTV
jgi:hypothetical protein